MEKNYRRCISCRHAAEKSFFWRVIKTHPHGEIELDVGSGRSAYICPKRVCLNNAKQKNRLQKSLKMKVPEQIYNVLENRLEI